MTRIYLSPPDVGYAERALLLEAFDSNWIAPLGPHVDAFEEELAARSGVAHAAALSSGTAALHLALRMFGVDVGDDVRSPTSAPAQRSLTPPPHPGSWTRICWLMSCPRGLPPGSCQPRWLPWTCMGSAPTTTASWPPAPSTRYR
jgi:hypothetical protein